MVQSIANILYQWEALGFFDIILPFLLIFAIVFGILSYIKAFGDQRPIHVIIAIVIGLLAIRYPLLSNVLAEITPRLGVGLVVILSLLLLIGLFIPGGHASTMGWIMLGVGAIIFIIILSQLGDVFGIPWLDGGGGGGSSDLISYIVLLVFLIGVVVAVVVSKDKTHTPDKGLVPFWGSTRQ